MHEEFKKWSYLIINITDGTELVCPSCKYEIIRYQYVGDLKTRIGCLFIWCEECNKGVILSRVKVPTNEKMLSFDSDTSDIIPNYKIITL